MSNRALASTPCVGSSISTDLGAVEKAARQHRLLLIAARQAADRLVESCGYDIQFVDQRLRASPAPSGAEINPPAAKSCSTWTVIFSRTPSVGNIDSRRDRR